jgi:hypothetical protein
MNQPINLKTTTFAVRNSISPATAGRGFLVIALALVCFALSPSTRAVSPPPDGGYPNGNTAEGTNALRALTTGFGNTAIGDSALFNNTEGGGNAATGYQALVNNTTGSTNTAIGYQALSTNTTGGDNTATGSFALGNNTTASSNTATGAFTLSANTTGSDNTATGASTLESNTTGSSNTATGWAALSFSSSGNNNTATGVAALCGCNSENTATGNNNTATGFQALLSNITGNNNTATGFNALVNNTAGSLNAAEGFQALANSSGSNNIALGANAGINLTTGNNNIDIGARGVGGESNTIRIGKQGVQKIAYIQGISGATVPAGVTVIVDTNGHLGTVQSSARFKNEIKPMDKASEAILALKPVTFRYKHELDPEGVPQFGLIAEQVEKVNPELVARDEKGQVYSVRYEAVNAMLLNEFLKEHHKVEQQNEIITQLKSAVAKQEATAAMQQKEISALTASLKKQAAQIQKVSERVELSKSAPQMAANNQ